MRSYINKLADYKDAPVRREVTISCPEEHIKERLRRITREGKTRITPDVIEKGDAAVLKLESSIDRFNRPMLPLSVGAGLFDPEFETGLTGHKTDEPFTVTVNGSPVEVSIISISRNIYPEPTDELAEKYANEHDMEGIHSVADYVDAVKREYMEDARRDIIYDTLESIGEYVLSHSDFAFDEGEIRELAELFEEELRSGLEEEGKTLDELSPSELEEYFGIENAEDISGYMMASAEHTIAELLWTAAENGIDVAGLDFGEAGQLEGLGWEFLEDYVNGIMNITEE